LVRENREVVNERNTAKARLEFPREEFTKNFLYRRKGVIVAYKDPAVIASKFRIIRDIYSVWDDKTI